ncbi:unnamed protein product [Eruca vesicaria subsp. sativa]|uniref:Uncharacterized protein n=1 Tax=Eruca vesicaria subsp. sativa TaxID=29727 RepID=A0ABC8LPE0_ERUVS|nr:unnamed protein product [Eruca vesicaria subsp. sativa]
MLMSSPAKHERDDLSGSDTLYLAETHASSPQKPIEFPIFANNTIHIPINDAHQILSDDEKRSLYDRNGEA